MDIVVNHQSELYRSAKGYSWQCDLTNRIYIHYNETVTAFKPKDFISFHKKVNSVNIHEMIFNLNDEFDYELIEAPQNGISLQLTLCEIIQLRELLDGTKFALKLNSMLHEVFGKVSLV
jgi:hypothetical protein